MGACEFTVQEDGFSAGDVFDELSFEARERYGDNGYNGTISTTNLCRCKKSYDSPTKSDLKAAHEFIRKDIDNCGKCDCYYVDLGVKEYQILKPKKVFSKEKPSFEMKFCVRESNNNDSKRTYSKTQAGAMEIAMNLALSTKKSYIVDKVYVNTSSWSNEVGRIEFEIRTCKTKPKKLPAGAVLRELHTYIFYGLAAE